MYKNTYFDLLYMRLKIWWLMRKARRMKRARALMQPRDRQGRFVKN